MNDADIILVGGGLANSLLALRLRQQRPDLRLLMIEQGIRPCGNHTWSFHDGDLSAAQHAWLEPWVGCRWPRYEVRFPAYTRTLESGYTSIFSDTLAAAVSAALGSDLQVATTVADIEATRVRLQDGQWLSAAAVIDGRGAPPADHLALGWQAFLGQEWELRQPHGLDRPVVMDATVAQQGGYRFVYLLPFSPTRLLIEDTHYVDTPGVDHERLRDHIGAYAAGRGWQLATLVREEHGRLPITLAGDFDAFWNDQPGLPRSGLRAGLFHPTTGYSLPCAVELAWRVAALDRFDAQSLHAESRAMAVQLWRRQRYFRALNRMLFLAGQPDRRWRVMQRFYRLPAGLVERFYAGELTLYDKVRIVSGKPPVPVGAALAAIARCRPDRIRSRS